MLISSKLKDGAPWFEVHKQGLVILRNFKNKRLRIIFNITREKDELQQFNSLFVGQTINNNINKCNESNYTSQLRISQFHKELPQNRVLIFLNAYENSDSTNLMILGYLIASVFFYHNNQRLSESSKLTKSLASLKNYLQDTQIQKLQQEIKFKSGFSKKPYFMCIFNKQQQSKPQSYHQLFRQFYKYQQGKDTLNEAVDAFIDYFPQRSAIEIANIQNKQESQSKLKKLSSQYVNKILGRQIFNFQITGLTVENLCFELCQVFNSKSKSIDLSKIYTKIINNQKIQVLDNCQERYTNLVSDLANGLPYNMFQLMQSHANIQKYIIQQSMTDAINCMTFKQYEPIYQNLVALSTKKWKQLKQSNKQLLRNRALDCYDSVDDDSDLLQLQNNINSDNLATILQLILEKITFFMNQNIFQFHTRDLLGRIISKHLDSLSQNIIELLKQKQSSGDNLTQRLHQLNLQNKTLQTKCKHFESQFLYLTEVNNQFKQKLLSISQPHENNQAQTFEPQSLNSTILADMKKKILDLQEELIEKNQIIHNLSTILDKFQIQFSRKYYKPKFNKEAQNLLAQVTTKSNQLHTLFAQLKRTQDYYKNIQLQFQEKKRSFDSCRENEKREKLQCQERIIKLQKQIKILQQAFQQARKTINSKISLQKQYKDCINQIQNGCSKLKCLLAQTEGQFEDYKKALELVATYCTTGKSDKLKDFIKVINIQQLKQILKPILRK